MLKKTLITYFPPAEKKKLVLLELKSDGTKRKRGTNASKGSKKPKAAAADSKPKDIHWLARELEFIFKDKVYNTIMEDDDDKIWYWVDTKQCEILGDVHDSNHVKFCINLSSKTYTQYCFSRLCEGQSGPQHDVPEKFRDSIDKYMKDERNKIRFANLFGYSNTTVQSPPE